MVRVELPRRVKKGLYRGSLRIPRGIRSEITNEQEIQARTRYITKQMLTEIGISDRQKRQGVQTAVTKHFKESMLINAEKERMTQKVAAAAEDKIASELRNTLRKILGKDYEKFEKVRVRIMLEGK